MHRHALAEGGDALREAVARLGTEPLDPGRERGARRVVEARDRVVVERCREHDGRETRRVEDLVGVRVADPREERRVGERALERMPLAAERVRELRARTCERLETAGIEGRERRLAGDDVERRAPRGAGLGELQRALDEVEGRETDALRQRRPRRLPLEASRDHEMHDEEEISLAREHDPLSHAPDPEHSPAARFVGRGRDGPQQERARDANPFQRAPDDAPAKRVEVDLEVGDLGHGGWTAGGGRLSLPQERGGIMRAMTTLAALWLPILLSAVFVFVASSLIHMVLQLHKSDFKKLPNEDAIRSAIRGTPPGMYMFPCGESMKDMQTPEMMEKMKVGPVGVMMVRPNGMWSLGPALIKWFVFTLIVSTFCAYLAGIGNAPGAAGKTVFQVTGAVAFLGYVFSHVHEWTWKGLETSIMVRFAIDGLVYTLITAGTFSWLWPAVA